MAEPLSWPDRTIGSVMPVERGDLPCGSDHSVWRRWTDGRHVSAFRTARGALAALLKARGAGRVLLPSYVCASVADGARAAGCEFGYFPIGVDLSVGCAALATLARPGDSVLGINYFGRAPGEDFMALVAGRRDIFWIEDRAQTLDTGTPPWGDVLLYSPRKLFGVADGGLLVAAGDLPAPNDDAPPDDLWRANTLRAEDPAGARTDLWFAASQTREAAFDAAPAPMSALTKTLLERTDARPHIEARQRNFAILAHHLRAWALLACETSPRFAPLAFPILVEDAARIAAVLGQQKLYCPRHWPALPCAADAFPDAHALSRRCLSIPCDPRYSADEMHRAGEAVRAVLQSHHESAAR